MVFFIGGFGRLFICVFVGEEGFVESLFEDVVLRLVVAFFVV